MTLSRGFRCYEVARIYGLVVLFGAAVSPLAAAEPRQSNYLDDVRIDMSTVKKFADESDNYPSDLAHATASSTAPTATAGGSRGPTSPSARSASAGSRARPQPDAVDTWEGDRAGPELLLAALERQELGDDLDRRQAAHVVHDRPAAGDGLHRGAAGHLDRRWRELDQGQLGVHAGRTRFLMPSFLQIGRGYRPRTMLPGGIMRYVYSYSARLTSTSPAMSSRQDK